MPVIFEANRPRPGVASEASKQEEKVPEVGIRVVDDLRDLDKDANGWANPHVSFTDLTKQTGHDHSPQDDRPKRNPELYTFQPQETDKITSWHINVGFIEDNHAALNTNGWKDAPNAQDNHSALSTDGWKDAPNADVNHPALKTNGWKDAPNAQDNPAVLNTNGWTKDTPNAEDNPAALNINGWKKDAPNAQDNPAALNTNGWKVEDPNAQDNRKAFKLYGFDQGMNNCWLYIL